MKVLLYLLTVTVLVSMGPVGCKHDDDESDSDPDTGYQLIWSDEFDSDSINPSNWSHEINCWGGGNNEQQCYTDLPQNSFVEDGVLRIVAIEGATSGPALQDDDPNYDPGDTSATLLYSSARLRTKDKFDFRYGRVEIRAKPAAGQGMWPALWMLPTDYVYGGWPLSGEIDIMEHVNLGVGPNDNLLFGTLHYGLPWPQWSVWGVSTSLEDAEEDYHVYAVEWEAGEIRWFVDGVHYQTQTSEGWYNYVWGGQESGFMSSPGHAPFDQDFHIIMNVAVGGDFPGAPDTGWTGNREMRVDYVRVYECADDPETGIGCEGSIDPVAPDLAVNLDAGGPEFGGVTVFADGPGTITFDVDGTGVDNTLFLNQFNPNGEVTNTVTDIGGDHGQVWDITFMGQGNAYLQSGDMSGVDGVEDGFALTGGSGWTINGELKFDLFVDTIGTDTALVVKMDSGYPNTGQVEIEMPPLGEWTEVSVRISDLLDNPIPGGSGLDLSNVLIPIVIEPAGGSGDAHIMIDNVRLQCAYNPTAQDWQVDKTCDIEPRLTSAVPPVAENILPIYEDAIDARWDMGYQEFETVAGHIDFAEVDAGSGDMVMDFTYNADGADGVAWLQSSTPQNLSMYAGGELVFDVNVLDWGTNTSGIQVKVECSAGVCSSGDYFIGDSASLGTGVDNTIRINMDDLINNVGSNLDLINVDVAMVIFPTWGDQQGVHFQVDNAGFELPDVLTVYEENVTFWDIGVSGDIDVEEIDEGGAHGNVVQFTWNTDTAVAFFQMEPMNLSAWAGGTLEFDFQAVQASTTGGNDWVFKMDCEYPCGSGDQVLGADLGTAAPTIGTWQTYSIAIDDLVVAGVELSHVDTPLVIFPSWGNQAGAVLKVDNIRLVKGP